MSPDIAISVKGVSKTFKIPHEKVSSIRGVFTSAFNGKRTFEEFKALDDVSFEVKKGEFFGIIGRNGSGKSTLLKVLAGIYQADKGKVKIHGMVSPFLELGIGFNPELSGRDNVYLNATVLGMSKKQIDEKFDSIVAFSELERFIDQKLKNYSSGMQVRLAFSVSIHANRDILLMDEVLAVGDMAFQEKCMDEFEKYRENGRTVILVTHDLLAAASYCDRLMLINDGRIVGMGKADEIVKKYSEIIDTENIARDDKRDAKAELYEGLSVSGISTLDPNGVKKSRFATYEDIRVRIDFDIHSGMELVFGVELFDKSGHILFGYHTQMERKSKRFPAGPCSEEIRLEKVPLLPGVYSYNIGIADKSCRRQYYYAKHAGEIVIEGSGKENFMMGSINIKTHVDE
jgi:ABC-type polysaccharide/polyol phosphate transport system ATPase subunit